MGLSQSVRELRRQFGRMWSSSRGPGPAGSSRVCRIEQMEPRRLLAAGLVPIHIGAVYLEDGSDRDDVGDLIEITWDGGAAGTQLTHVQINTDRGLDGARTDGDPFFDTEPGGAGIYDSVPLSIVDQTGIDFVSITVDDGGTLLSITAIGWDPGEKLVLSVDVDEQGFGPGDATAVAEGGEFQHSHLAAVFQAPNYYTASGTDTFLDEYNPKLASSKLAGSKLDLPNDEWVPPSPWTPPGANPGIVYTAGAIFQVNQELLPTIQGNVFEDIDADNVWDAGEVGLAGVQLELYELVGGTYVPTGQTTATDALGHYEFHVLPGTYEVREAQPGGYLSVGATAGTVGGVTRGTVLDSDTITDATLTGSEDSVHNDFAETRPAELSGHVYHDADNDGVFDAGETGIGGATVRVYYLPSSGPAPPPVEVVTGADGSWSVSGLMPGDYRVEEVQPSPYLDGLDAAGSAGGTAHNPGDSITGVQLVSGQSGTDYDFGELLPGSISGRVHADRNGDCTYQPGEPLLAGVTVHLLDGSGTIIDTTQTDAKGEYSFTNLAPGVYGVYEIQPAGYDDGPEHVGSVGGNLLAPDSIVSVDLPSGVDAVRYDFCELERMDLAGYVYVDDNNDGVKAAGEPGIAGVTLNLLDATGKPVATTTTDAAGHYVFADLPAGVYSIVEAQPAGYYDGLDTPGSLGGAAHNPGDSITAIPGAPAVHGTDYNFGELRPGSISGRVHAELNGDCVRQPGEPVLSGVTVYLLDAAGNRIATTTTDANGEYTFGNLEPFKQYTVQEVQPAGYLQGRDHVGSEGGLNPSANLLTQVPIVSGTDAVEYNFCEMTPARISGYVFQDGPAILVLPNQAIPDLTALHDGRLTPDDTRLGGVTVVLSNAGGVVATTTTDASGYYEFTDLPFGEYTITEVQPAGYIDSIDTPGSEGGVADARGDRIAHITLEMGDAATSYNFSEVAVTPYYPEFTPDPEPPVPLPPPQPVGAQPPAAPSPIPLAPPPPEPPPIGGGGLPLYSWHLSVVNAGRPRRDQEGEIAAAGQGPFTLVSTASRDGADMDQSRWLIDGEGGRPGEFFFGQAGAIPVTGDFNGDGVTEVGVFIDGQWFIDLNGNGVWDDGDVWYELGHKGDRPVTGDWDGDGKTDIGIFGPSWLGDVPAAEVEPGLPDAENPPTVRPKNMPPEPHEATSGKRVIQRTAGGKLRSDLIDHVFIYGNASHHAVAGDFNGDGIASIGIFRNGTWQLDVNGNGLLDDGEARIQLGQAGDLPVVGDWSGDGIDDLGVYRAGTFYLDSNGDGTLGPEDAVIHKGGPGDLPVVGDWDGDGVDEVGVYQPGAAPPKANQASL